MASSNGVEEGETIRSSSLSNGGFQTSDHTTAHLVPSALLQARIEQPILPPGSLPNTLRELREMESLLKAKKKLLSSMKKQHADTDEKRITKKLLEEQLKALKTEAKNAKAEAKQEENARATGKRSRQDYDPNDSDEGSEDFDLFKRPGKRILTTIDNGRRGIVRLLCVQPVTNWWKMSLVIHGKKPMLTFANMVGLL